MGQRLRARDALWMSQISHRRQSNPIRRTHEGGVQVTPDPLDPSEQAAFRELDQLRRCPDNCPCRMDDAMTTPLDLNDIE